MSSHVGDDPKESFTFGKSLSLKVPGDFNAVSISPSGRDVVLAGRLGLYIIDLDDPFSPPRYLPHVTPWQVADVQWSPHPAKPNWVVSTSNQKALIWNLDRPSSNAIELSLRCHTRAITDIHFSPQQPNILATCSVDTYVHAWDLRSPKRPFYSVSTWKSSVSQVRWNYHDSNILASSHGNAVFLWDLRKGSTPLTQLSGHSSSINSIEFNRFKPSEIMSCSNDGTVKFWDYSKDCDESIRTIITDFPIWRGRYLPFGVGCCIMPMIGGNNSLYLTNLSPQDDANKEVKSTKLQPIYTFKGHTDTVLEFLWRSRHSYNTDVDDREFELVTWSKDNNLRLWPIPDSVYERVNFHRYEKLEEKLPDLEYKSYATSPRIETLTNKDEKYERFKEMFVTTSGLKRDNDINHIDWLAGVRMDYPDSPNDLFEGDKLHNLGEEVCAIGHKFPKVIFEKISVCTGELIVVLDGPWSNRCSEEYIRIRVKIKVPPDYPTKGNPPIFVVEENCDLSEETRHELMNGLEELGKKYTDSGFHCLQACLHYLLGEKMDLDLGEQITEPLLNFNFADDIEMEASSISSASGKSDQISNFSSDSKDGTFKDMFAGSILNKNAFGRNLEFDTTPVPNECGAVWTADGQLLCFLRTDNKLDRKQGRMSRLTQRSSNGALKLFTSISKSEQDRELRGDLSREEKGEEEKVSHPRPKRYVDTLFAGDESSSDSAYDSNDQTVSDDSFDSFMDDWNDVIGNDIVERTKLSTVLGNFTRSVAPGYSESAKTTDSVKHSKNTIIMRDLSHLIPDSKDLASEYWITNVRTDEMARHNALIAEKYGFEEISHCWQILSDFLLNYKDNDPLSVIWDNHPSGTRWFFRESIKYFERRGNVQMLAMLCCVAANLWANTRKGTTPVIPREKLEISITYDLQDTRQTQRLRGHPHYTAVDDPMRSIFQRPRLLNRQTKSEESLRYGKFLQLTGVFPKRPGSPITNRTNKSGTFPPNQAQPPKTTDVTIELPNDEISDAIRNPLREVLDILEIKRCKRYIYQYAKLLFRWNLPMERVELLKVTLDAMSSMLNDDSIIIDSSQLEVHDKSLSIRWFKQDEKNVTFRNCIYCDLQITRHCFVCGNCQHIMHSKCAKEWWAIGNECPSGCGCHCIEMYDVQHR